MNVVVRRGLQAAFALWRDLCAHLTGTPLVFHPYNRGVLWLRPLTMLRLLALLALSETVRTAFFVAALPISGSGLHLSAALIGSLAGGHYLADALAKGPSGLLTNRYGLGVMLLLGTLLGLGAVLLTRWYPHPALTLLTCVAWGLGYAALWPGVMSTSQALAHPQRTARALAISSLSVAPAILVGALGVGPLMQTHPNLAWTALMVTQGISVLLALSLLGLGHSGRPSEGLNSNPGEFGPTSGNVWRDWSRVAALLPAAFVQTLAPGLLVTIFYPLLAHLNLGLRDLLAPGALALVVFGLSVWLMGRRADRDHPRRALLPGLLLLALTFAVAAFPGVGSRLWLLAPLLGVGYGAFITGWNGLVARTLPGDQRAAAWGTVMAVEALGYAIGPVLGGAAWQAYGTAGVFSLGAAAFLLAVAYDLLTQGRRQDLVSGQ